jgi:2-hydroxycyclohexanecarboxyl-CoA dehydrogenase
MTKSPVTTDQPELSGRVGVVTGAGRGIGKRIALRMAERGVAVAVWDRRAEAASATVEEIVAAGGCAVAHAVDVSVLAAVEEALEGTIAALGSVDVLVNNAATMGIERDMLFWELDQAQWEDTIRSTFFTALVPSRVVLPQMIARGSGRIVSISSGAAHHGEPRAVVYSAAKGAVESFTRALARAVGRYGITVNCVAPGMVLTPWTEARVSVERRHRAAELYPMRRVGVPDDVAGAVLYLASDVAAWVTGQVLHVNGGFYT